MYKILDLYKLGYGPKRPVICMDEKSKQLLEDVRKPMPMKPGSPEKRDYEYKRNGTRNIFVAVEPKAGRHITKVTKRRTKKDFSYFIKNLVMRVYKNAEKTRIVLDNLNTHFPKSLYETFSRTEAEKILERIEFYYTPKHASWLDMAEIEINIMETECLNRRIASADILISEIKQWTKEKNKQKKKIKWGFTKRDAYKKLFHHFVP